MKSMVIAVDAELDVLHGNVVVTFLRYDESRTDYKDWMQSHCNLTRASCVRVERILQDGRSIVWPDRLVVVKETDEEYWSRHRKLFEALRAQEEGDEG